MRWCCSGSDSGFRWRAIVDSSLPLLHLVDHPYSCCWHSLRSCFLATLMFRSLRSSHSVCSTDLRFVRCLVLPWRVLLPKPYWFQPSAARRSSAPAIHRFIIDRSRQYECQIFCELVRFSGDAYIASLTSWATPSPTLPSGRCVTSSTRRVSSRYAPALSSLAATRAKSPCTD
jgi:hypothetical protein